MSYVAAREWMDGAHGVEQGGDRLYNLLAFFDTRDGTAMAVVEAVASLLHSVVPTWPK